MLPGPLKVCRLGFFASATQTRSGGLNTEAPCSLRSSRRKRDRDQNYFLCANPFAAKHQVSALESSTPSLYKALFNYAKKPYTMSFLARRAVAAPRVARAFSTTPARPVAKITLIGNLAGPPELSATSTGREILKYAVASNTGRGENQKTSWFRVTSFENEGPRRDYFQSLPKGCVYIYRRCFLSRRITMSFG